MWGSGAALVTFWRARPRSIAGRRCSRSRSGSLGAALGARLVLRIDNETLRPIVIAMLIGAAVLLVVKKPARDEDAPPGVQAGRYLALAGRARVRDRRRTTASSGRAPGRS